jgi:hypothetical protein
MASETSARAPRGLLARTGLLAVLLVAASPLACGDPVKDLAVEALGPEAPGVPEGPLHRPGQPCLVCHDGATARAYSVAGTVYLAPDAEEPAAGTSVHLIDAEGQRFTAVTNCAGNFFLQPGELDPIYPVWTALRAGTWQIAMESPIHGEGSCAGCHGLAPGPSSAGRVYVFPIAPEPPPAGCQ